MLQTKNNNNRAIVIGISGTSCVAGLGNLIYFGAYDTKIYELEFNLTFTEFITSDKFGKVQKIN